MSKGDKRRGNREVKKPKKAKEKVVATADFTKGKTLTSQYASIVRYWVTSIGLEASAYGTHSMRRTKVTQIYKKTGNLRAVQLLLGHTMMDSSVRYLGVELEDALMIAESIEI